jgi:hypothetical protein
LSRCGKTGWYQSPHNAHASEMKQGEGQSVQRLQN